jgi:hypothetical protein
MSSGTPTSDEVHGSLSAALGTVGIALLLAPIAFVQYGPRGIGIVAVFAATIVLSLWISARGAAMLARKNRLLAGLFVTSGVRMLLPLSLSLILVATDDRIAPLASTLYFVPLYMGMLVADLAEWTRRPNFAVARPLGNLATSGSTSIGGEG